MHPTWEYKLWTDVDNRELVRRHYPWFLEMYDGFPQNIMRADAVRTHVRSYTFRLDSCISIDMEAYTQI
jgi:mannosyltransferase OCH1-like enzyme